jgi:hypothetical protein
MCGDVAIVGNRNLRLAVGAKKVDAPGLAILREAVGELVREHDRQRHHLVAFVAGVAKHDPLIAGALIAALARRGRHTLANLV